MIPELEIEMSSRQGQTKIWPQALVKDGDIELGFTSTWPGTTSTKVDKGPGDTDVG